MIRLASHWPLCAALAAALAVPQGAIAQDSAAPALPSAHGYQPQDELERGLWYEMDEQEKLLKRSRFLVEDEDLNAYVRGVLCRTVGEDRCRATRLYIVRSPHFNASMAPNGVMIVYTGLLLRMRDEAQLAAVLGHEFTHFEKQHSLRLFREMRKKTDLLSWFSFLPLPIPYAGMVGQLAIVGSIYSFNRDMEREADAGSIEELVRAGYDPMAASTIWAQLGAEMDATAAERGHRSRKDKNGGLFATHPRSTERMERLAQIAAAASGDGERLRRAAEYRAGLGAWWPRLIEDQVSRQDFGGTEYLLGALAGSEEGWTADLLYARGELYRARGEEGDFTRAAGFYRQAIALEDAPVESWRGLGLAELRAGNEAAGRAALRDYLARAPQAEDAEILAMMAAGDAQ